MLSSSMTLSEFFSEFYVRSFELSQDERVLYESALKHWKGITSDPPLREITSDLMAIFSMEIESDRNVAQPRDFVNRVQWIIDQAGPQIPESSRLRYAAGLLDRVPWTKTPEYRPESFRHFEPHVMAAMQPARCGRCDRCGYTVIRLVSNGREIFICDCD